MTVVRLTFPQSEAATSDPLPEAVAASNGADGEPVPAVISLRPSSN
jgi:hypothetical protein